MTEQIPSTDGTPATEYPVVAGAGQSFDDLNSSTPLSADAESSDADQGDAGPIGDVPADGAAPAGG